MDPAPQLPGGDPLKAALADQWRLLDLQGLDTRLDQLAHRRRNLPELAARTELEARRDRVRDLLIAARTEETDVAGEQAKAEGDVEQVRTRAERDQRRLDAGQVTAPKELESLQHEITSLARRQSDLEEIVLEIMERREAAQTRIGELTAEGEQIADELTKTTEAIEATTGQIDTEAEATAAERAPLARSLPGELVELYEKVRAAHGGIAAVALRRGRCEGCHIELSTTDLARVKAEPDDAVIRCEDCRRILIRVSDSGL